MPFTIYSLAKRGQRYYAGFGEGKWHLKSQFSFLGLSSLICKMRRLDWISLSLEVFHKSLDPCRKMILSSKFRGSTAYYLSKWRYKMVKIKASAIKKPVYSCLSVFTNISGIRALSLSHLLTSYGTHIKNMLQEIPHQVLLKVPFLLPQSQSLGFIFSGYRVVIFFPQYFLSLPSPKNAVFNFLTMWDSASVICWLYRLEMHHPIKSQILPEELKWQWSPIFGWQL